MRRKSIYHILCSLAVLVVFVTTASAQKLPERRIVREGNEQFSRMNYRSSLNLYNEALEHDSTRVEILYNRANAYYQTLLQHRQDSSLTWEASNELFETIANDELLDKKCRAEALRNIGESLFTQQNYEASLNAFRESLLLNPDDSESKYNYILTKRIVDQLRQQQQQQQQQQSGNGESSNEQNPDQQQSEGEGEGGNSNQQQNDKQQNQDPNQNPDQQQEGDNKQSEDNKESEGENDEQNRDQQQNDDEGEGNNNENESDNSDEQQQAPPQNGNVTTDEQERMLDLIQAQEDKTQEKLKDKRKAIVVSGKKNW